MDPITRSVQRWRIGARVSSSDRSVRWIAFLMSVGLIAVIWLWWMPSHVHPAMSEEQRTYLTAVDRMRSGEGYYEAMSTSLVSPPSQVRSLRLPTIFLVWRFTGISWPLTLLIILISGFLLSLITDPIVGALGTLWLAMAGFSLANEMWAEVEFWVLPLLLGAMLALRRDRWSLAVVLILLAALVRELAVPCLVFGGIAAWRAGRPVRPWVLATGAWTAFYALHVALARPWLVAGGNEAPMIGTGGLDGFLAMAGIGLGIVAPVIVVYAIWHARFRSEWWLVLPLIVGIPLVGFFIMRLYWAVLVFPLAIGLLGPAAVAVERPHPIGRDAEGPPS